MLLSLHIVSFILHGLCQVVIAQQFDEVQFSAQSFPLDPFELTSRQSAAAEAFNYSNPAVVDAELEAWKARAKFGNQAIPICPANCQSVGPKPAAWAVFPDVLALKACDKTQLLDLAVFTLADGEQEANAIRACTADNPTRKPAKKRQNASKNSCIPASEVERKVAARLEAVGSGAIQASSVSGALVTAGRELATYLGDVELPDCGASAVSRFAITPQNTVFGVYSGAQAHRQGATVELLDKVLSSITANGVPEGGLTAEVCVQDLGADYIAGVAASTNTQDGLKIVQDAVRVWSNGTCLLAPSGMSSSSSSSSKTPPWADVSLRVPAPIHQNSTSEFNTTTAVARGGASGGLTKRAVCRYISVVSGDGCASLASKCGISGADFTKFNPSSTLCSTLREGQVVCCNSGTLPDLTPKPDKDGNCAWYEVKGGDYCAKIAAANQITVAQLEEYNTKTWGWNGCEVLWANIKICLSKGSPPMPNWVNNAVCGPTVNNTFKPTDGTDIALLNPCPLNVCCNVWGQCGLSEDFCIEKKSKTGAPGTSGLQNGCISSCGMEILRGPVVAKDMRIGYFEAWNGARPCLRSHIFEYKNRGYTHIHWAFANLTEDFKPDISGLQDQWDEFKAMTDVKKIVSFGGWAFSTESGTWPIFKKAVMPGNREKFRDNVVKFVADHGLDGADFDWEYPAPPDIPGVPQGDLEEGANYGRFLALMRAALPKDKTVSFAAPASYWYLKQFPMKTISKSADYIIYMTYDLHGQWDAGNKWAAPGCETGNCLRSHVNLTETALSLAMITKAGVDPAKVIVGVASYGRSFHMAQKGCDGPNCFFTGDHKTSEAAKGRCTGVSGYISNGEIEEIITNSPADKIKRWSDSTADYLVYNDLEWVSYMTPVTKSQRQTLYHGMGFGGTTDWAIDLQGFLPGEPNYDSPGDIDMEPLKPCDGKYNSLGDVDRDKDSMLGHCVAGYTMDALAAEMEKGLSDYDAIMKTDYDEKFGYFAKAIRQKWDTDLGNLYSYRSDEFFNCVNAVPLGDHKFENRSIGCPPKFISGYAYNIYMIPKDEQKLSDFLSSEYGIDRAWTRGGSLALVPCTDFCDEYGKLYGQIELKPDFSVPNPKDSIAQSINNIRALPAFYRYTASFLKVNFLGEDPTDAVDGSAVPVFMIQQAVQSMREIYEAGKEIQQKEMENLILMCITAFLFILPGLGEAMAAVSGIAMIGRIAAMVAEAGGLATGAYDLATNKGNSALAIFSFLLGFVGLRGALKGKWSDAATIRRGMSAKEIEGMGDIVKHGLERVARLTNKVCKV